MAEDQADLMKDMNDAELEDLQRTMNEADKEQ